MEHEHSLPLTVTPSHLYVSAHYDWRSGWALRVSQDAPTALRAPATTYEGLSAAELVDVVGAELDRRLRGASPPA